MWFLYIVQCSDGSFYTGITKDVERRIHEHNHSKRGAKYTRARRPVFLRAFWPCLSRQDALRAEAALKKKRRSEKEARILEWEEDHKT